MNKKQIAITLGVMCSILTCGIVMQLNTIENAVASVGSSFSETELRDQVLRWKDKYDNTYFELEKAEEELEKNRQAVSKKDDSSLQLEKELEKNNILLGSTDVTGEGVIIHLEDSIDLVHDLDIITIVNELKNAGAEAISINDQRIVTTTAITCDGNVILINGQKIGTPFTILAIGYPEKLMGALSRPGGYIELLNEDGVYADIRKSNNIKIPKYSGIITYKYMRNV